MDRERNQASFALKNERRKKGKAGLPVKAVAAARSLRRQGFSTGLAVPIPGAFGMTSGATRESYSFGTTGRGA